MLGLDRGVLGLDRGVLGLDLGVLGFVERGVLLFELLIDGTFLGVVCDLGEGIELLLTEVFCGFC